MRSVDGLRLHGRIPPGIVEDDVAGGGQVEARAGGAQTEQENAAVRVLRKGLRDFLAILGLSGQDVRADLSRGAFPLQDAEHLDKLAEEQNLVVLREQWLQQFKKRLGLARNGVVADQEWMAANLAQPRQGGQDVNGAAFDPAFGH